MRSRKAVLNRALFVVAVCITSAAIRAADRGFDTSQTWQAVNTFGILPMDPDEAANTGWTANGLWAGYSMPEAIRSVTHVTSDSPVTWSYPTAKEYVDASHMAGVLVPATLLGVQATPHLRTRFPELEQGACRTVDGERAYWEKSSDAYAMCMNKPQHQKVLIALGKEAIDAGADMIVIDEIQGNEFWFYWFGEPGFCDGCLNAYRSHLSSNFSAEQLREQFDIEDLDSFDFAARLKGENQKDWNEADPLFRELWLLQERISFESRKELVGTLRDYMKEKGHVIPIYGNTPNVGLMNYRGWRLKAARWSKVVDSIAYEVDRLEPLPRGKWIAYERMAEALYSLNPVPFMNNVTLIRDIHSDYAAGKNWSVQLYALLAEANANHCNFANYFLKLWFPDTIGLWEDCFRGQRFIVEHRELFEPEAASGATVAVLFIENEGQRYRTESFQGVAQALAESQIPFDVLVDGGDAYVPVTLKSADLAPYDLVVLPHALELHDTQLEAIYAFIQQGGHVLTFDPESFDLPNETATVERGQGRLIVLPKIEHNKANTDPAALYLQTYDDNYRKRIADAVNANAKSVVEVAPADRSLEANLWYQHGPRRTVLHLVNTDYDPTKDAMRPKSNITVRFAKPPYQEVPPESATLISPDAPSATINVSEAPGSDGELWQLTVPHLDVYNVIWF